MGSTLLATSSVALCVALAAVLNSVQSNVSIMSADPIIPAKIRESFPVS